MERYFQCWNANVKKRLEPKHSFNAFQPTLKTGVIIHHYKTNWSLLNNTLSWRYLFPPWHQISQWQGEPSKWFTKKLHLCKNIKIKELHAIERALSFLFHLNIKWNSTIISNSFSSRE